MLFIMVSNWEFDNSGMITLAEVALEVALDKPEQDLKDLID